MVKEIIKILIPRIEIIIIRIITGTAFGILKIIYFWKVRKVRIGARII